MPLLLPSKYIKGVRNEQEARAFPKLEQVSIDDILTVRHNTDAHMLNYRFVRADLPNVRVLKAAGMHELLVTDLIIFDFDLPGHRPWDSQQELLETIEEAVSIIPDTYAIYSTVHGFRQILKLPTEYQVFRLEAYYPELIKQLGIPFDKDCADWTRCFRLPYVTRDGKRLWEDPLIDCMILGKVFEASIPSIVPVKKSYSIPMDSSMPGNEVVSLVWQK